MNWLLFIANSIVGGFIQYQHQTNKVSDSSYPVTRPPAKVSVIIPAYNEESFIARALLSIQSQNVVLAYPDLFEVIVVDDGSTDRTAEIASQYAKMLSLEKQPGIYYVRHAGIEAAEGEIIVFADADMIWKPNFLNLLLRHFHNPEIVGVCGGFFNVDADPLTLLMQANYNALQSVIISHINMGVCAFRKDAYYAMGGYDFSIEQMARTDEKEIDFTRKLKSVGRVVWDLEANVWAEARIRYCLTHPTDKTCDSPYCRYCLERIAGKRF